MWTRVESGVGTIRGIRNRLKRKCTSYSTRGVNVLPITVCRRPRLGRKTRAIEGPGTLIKVEVVGYYSAQRSVGSWAHPNSVRPDTWRIGRYIERVSGWDSCTRSESDLGRSG